jgi:phosphoribosylformylglycinamidine synthase
MTWRVHVRILPRAGLLDPQGQAVEHALSALHFPEASNVHVGKAIALDVAATEDYEIAVDAEGRP